MLKLKRKSTAETPEERGQKRLEKAQRLGRWLNRLAKISPKTAGRLAFRLFCTPFSGRIRKQDEQFLLSADRHFLDFEGQKIAAYEWGEPQQPLVVFAHGWESNAARWRHYVRKAIEKGFRVVAFDAPAHGASGGRQINVPIFTRSLVAVVAHFGRPEALVGHSLGGGAVIRAVAKTEILKPKKVVILGSFARSADVLAHFYAMLGLNEEVQNAVETIIVEIAGEPITEFSNVKTGAQIRDVAAFFVHDAGDDVVAVQDGRDNFEAWAGLKNWLETEGYGHKLQHPRVIEHVFRFLFQTEKMPA